MAKMNHWHEAEHFHCSLPEQQLHQVPKTQGLWTEQVVEKEEAQFLPGQAATAE